MMNEIQAPRFNALLQKLLAMRGGAPSPTLATDVFPTLNIDALLPEYGYLRDERWCSGGVVDAAVAGQYSHIGLKNPADSGILVFLDKVIVASDAAIRPSIYIRTVGANDAESAGVLRDTRWTGTTQARIWSLTQVAALAAQNMGRMVAGGSLTVEPGITLSPGYEWYCRPSGVNERIELWFQWRERPYAQNESK